MMIDTVLSKPKITDRLAPEFKEYSQCKIEYSGGGEGVKCSFWGGGGE